MLHLGAPSWSDCSRMEQRRWGALAPGGRAQDWHDGSRMRRRTIRKTVVVLPAELLADVDRAAGALGESRSRYITRILRCAVRARRHAAITRRLDELFADPVLAEEQRRTAAQLDAIGSSWNDERW